MHMPGFRSLSENVTGSVAERAREAAALEESGDHRAAIAVYEAALEESAAIRPQLPGFVCGRLAAAYRRQGRYQDELDLIERYRDSQTDDDARSRFDARLSKARALADKHTRRDSAALASVRAIKPSARRARRSSSRAEDSDSAQTES